MESSGTGRSFGCSSLNASKTLRWPSSAQGRSAAPVVVRLRGRFLRNRLMRHCRGRNLALAVSVSRLARSVQPPSAKASPVPCSSATQRLPPLLRAAPTAEPLTAVAEAAQPKLNGASPTVEEPVRR